jgi:Zn-dependent protease
MSNQNNIFRKTKLFLMPGVTNTFRQEVIELTISTIIISISFGITIGGGHEVFSDPSSLIKYSWISLVAVSSGFILHELGHRMVARSYGYVARYSMWMPGLLLGLFTSFTGLFLVAPGAVIIRKKDGLAGFT